MSAKSTPRPTGIPCPECGDDRAVITDSRPADGHYRRRRQCANGHRFTTHEVLPDRQSNHGTLPLAVKSEIVSRMEAFV